MKVKLSRISIHLAHRQYHRERKLSLSNTTPSAIFRKQKKDLAHKQFRERLMSIGLMLLLLVGLTIIGFQFTSTRLETESWIRVIAGCGICWYSIYGIKIILKIK